MEASGTKDRTRSRQMDRQKTMIDKQEAGRWQFQSAGLVVGTTPNGSPRTVETVFWSLDTPSRLSWVARGQADGVIAIIGLNVPLFWGSFKRVSPFPIWFS